MCTLLLTGSGVDIYVFAEGINLDHEEFEGRAFDGGYGLSQNCSSNYYGTHVASLAVGKSVGVATKANVYRYGLPFICKLVVKSYMYYNVTDRELHILYDFH